jgi:sulfofructosephosphate aldolase
MSVPNSLERTLEAVALPSGGFAMLAIDQRESLRNMFSAKVDGAEVADETLRDFKLAVVEEMAGTASAILMDQLFGREAFPVISAMPHCGLIVASDHLVQPTGSPVLDTQLDDDVDLELARANGAVAAKLLVLWRGDNEAQCRALVDEFLTRCADAGLLSVVEAIVKPPTGHPTWTLEDGIVQAAIALAPGADLYKCEIPFHGDARPDEIRRESERVTEAIRCPWVVLSSGVLAERFPAAVQAACQGGASGFLAGRAVWADTVGPGDYRERIRTESVPRMAALIDIVNEHARPWRSATV